MVAALALTYWTITDYKGIGQLVLGFMAYAFFVLLVIRHQKLRRNMHQLKAIIQINEAYIKRLQDGWHAFEDQGEEWMDYEHPYGMDLDIVGPKSLFQKINIASTWHGRKRLAQVLLEGCIGVPELTKRQQAVNELINNLDFCQQIQCMSKGREPLDQNPQRLLDYMGKQESFVSELKFTKLLGWFPWLVCLAILAGFVFERNGLLLVGIIGALFMYGIYILHYGKVQECLLTMREVEGQLQSYGHIMEKIVAEPFYSPYLKSIQELLGDQDGGAGAALGKLRKICDRSTFTLQPLLAIPLNALWGWDFKCIQALELWRSQYGSQLTNWVEAVGEMECLGSLAVVGQIEDEVVMPLVEENSKRLSVVALGHPLLGQETRISNNLNMEDELLVVTGSNMSGKTTFLRTLGINLVLAYSGSMVIAQKMHVGHFAICTSMRIKDDLQEGVSTFYAELKRIKQMLEIAENNPYCIGLIDEIFRGTNSKDRILGAKSVLRGLKQAGAIGGITTHDLELCELGQEKGITNYHFTEYYEDQTIRFDYKIKEGPSTSTNAKYLMEMVGIKIGEL